MAVSEDVWESMSPDLQALMEEVAKDAVDLCREGLEQSESKDLETLKGCLLYTSRARGMMSSGRLRSGWM